MSLGWNISLLILQKIRNILDFRAYFTSIYFTLETFIGYQNSLEFIQDPYSININPNQTQTEAKTQFFTPKFHLKWNNFFSFNKGFQALQFHKIWTKCTKNLLTDPLNNSVNWVYASGHLCIVLRCFELCWCNCSKWGTGDLRRAAASEEEGRFYVDIVLVSPASCQPSLHWEVLSSP